MKTLAIDIETYSSVDLLKSGVYAYSEAPDFTVLLFAYAFDADPVALVDLASGESIPETVIDALRDNENILKTAFNANFERTCLARFLGFPMQPEGWQCTAVQAATLGLPHHLDGVAKVMKLGEQKDSRGKALIKFFSVPCKATKVNGGRTRNLSTDDLEKWEVFKDYCKQDVEVERSIRNKLSRFKNTGKEKILWDVDQKINDRGVLIDQNFVIQAIQCDQAHKAHCLKRAVEMTGLENPKSVTQLKAWVESEGSLYLENFNKETVQALISETENPAIKEVLKLRADLSKTSTKKYETMIKAKCQDNRVRGLFQFYGANRTGRFAGRLVQVQNLPQNHLKDLELARTLVKDGYFDTFNMLFGNTPATLSELIRTAFIPTEGRRFIVSDFSAIEARVIAWLSGEKWRMDVFATHGKIYEASASQMFHVPIESIVKGSPLRQKGKVSELALGYAGGVGALKTMGALEMGVPEEELQGLVDGWRVASPNIVKFWWAVEKAVRMAIADKPSKLQYGLGFEKFGGILFIRLPSGRRLAYINPRLEPDPKFNREGVVYDGQNQTTKKWEKIRTYSGKLAENIVQAVARDCLAESMIRLDRLGFDIVMHVHDEVILDVEKGQSSAEAVAEIMGEPLDWAPGLLLRADAYETDFYQKD
ncbi:MAG: DNA polymerase [Eubacterium sp.]